MSDNEKITKYSIFKSFIQPFWIISDNMKTFFIQGSFFTVFVVLLSYLFGQKYLCLFTEQLPETLYCPANNALMYIPYLLIKIIAIFVCIKIWYNTVFEKINIDKNYFKSMWKSVLRLMLLFIVFIILNIMPLVSGLILFIRKPNPVWQIEVMFFTFVSIGFLLPFVSLRFYSLLAVLLNTGKFTDIKNIWKKTKGLTIKILIATSLIYLVCLLCFVSITGHINISRNMPAELHNVIAETLFAFISYFIVILFVNFCEKQRQAILQ